MGGGKSRLMIFCSASRQNFRLDASQEHSAHYAGLLLRSSNVKTFERSRVEVPGYDLLFFPNLSNNKELV